MISRRSRAFLNKTKDIGYKNKEGKSRAARAYIARLYAEETLCNSEHPFFAFLIYLRIYLFIYSFIHSFIHSFIRSFVHSFIHLFNSLFLILFFFSFFLSFFLSFPPTFHSLRFSYLPPRYPHLILLILPPPLRVL
jgi:hypothetical protein